MQRAGACRGTVPQRRRRRRRWFHGPHTGRDAVDDISAAKRLRARLSGSRHYLRSELPGAVDRALHSAWRERLRLGTVTRTEAVTLLAARPGCWKDAVALSDKCKSHGWLPGVRSVAALLAAGARDGMVSDPLFATVIGDMQLLQAEQQVVCWGFAVRMLARAVPLTLTPGGDTPDTGQRLWELWTERAAPSLPELYRRQGDSSVMGPLFCSMLSACTGYAQAREVLGTMRSCSFGLGADARLWGALLGACARGGDVDAAAECLRRMQDRFGAAPEEGHWAHLLRAQCAQGQVAAAQATWLRMERAAAPPGFRTRSAAIRGLAACSGEPSEQMRRYADKLCSAPPPADVQDWRNYFYSQAELRHQWEDDQGAVRCAAAALASQPAGVYIDPFVAAALVDVDPAEAGPAACARVACARAAAGDIDGAAAAWATVRAAGAKGLAAADTQFWRRPLPGHVESQGKMWPHSEALVQMLMSLAVGCAHLRDSASDEVAEAAAMRLCRAASRLASDLVEHVPRSRQLLGKVLCVHVTAGRTADAEGVMRLIQPVTAEAAAEFKRLKDTARKFGRQPRLRNI